jgi:hypothetical protein
VETLVTIKEGTFGLPDECTFQGGTSCFNGEFQSLLDAEDEFDVFFGVEGVFNVDPLFVNAPGGDYHLSETSPMIDVCADDPQGTDIDLEPRGVDDPLTLDIDGTFDVGADELQPDPNALIFSDGFESGDVSAWSSSVP